MSIAATSVSETAVAAQVLASSTTTTPTKRKAVAKADPVTQPEPR